MQGPYLHCASVGVGNPERDGARSPVGQSVVGGVRGIEWESGDVLHGERVYDLRGIQNGVHWFLC